VCFPPAVPAVWCGTLILMAIALLPFAPTAVARSAGNRGGPTPFTPNAAPNLPARQTRDRPHRPHWPRRRSQAYVFAQEENFYYLTGHNEEERD